MHICAEERSRPGKTEAPHRKGLSAVRGKPSIQRADPGRGFSLNPLLVATVVVDLDSIRAVPRGEVRLLSRSSALGKQPFAQEAQISLTALPDPGNTLAFNFCLEQLRHWHSPAQQARGHACSASEGKREKESNSLFSG